MLRVPIHSAVQIWLQKDFSPPTAAARIHKVTVHRLKPFEATPKPPEGSAEAPEEPDAAADVDPEADAEQFVQHASSNMCEPLLRAAALGTHGRMLGGLVQQVSSLLLRWVAFYCSFRARKGTVTSK